MQTHTRLGRKKSCLGHELLAINILIQTPSRPTSMVENSTAVLSCLQGLKTSVAGRSELAVGATVRYEARGVKTQD